MRWGELSACVCVAEDPYQTTSYPPLHSSLLHYYAHTTSALEMHHYATPQPHLRQCLDAQNTLTLSPFPHPSPLFSFLPSSAPTFPSLTLHYTLTRSHP